MLCVNILAHSPAYTGKLSNLLVTAWESCGHTKNNN